MKIVLCGSIKHLRKMYEVKLKLEDMGHEAELPHGLEQYLDIEDLTETKSREKKNWYIKKHMEKIENSDAILVINEEKNGIQNYIGGNTFLEMGHAMNCSKAIYILNEIPEESPYLDEITGMLPIVLNGNLSLIRPG